MEFTKSEIEAWRKVVTRGQHQDRVGHKMKGRRGAPFPRIGSRSYFTNGHLPSLSGR